MKGKTGGGGEELSLQEQENNLRQAISGLEKKKVTLEKDIATAYQEVKNRVELELNERSTVIEKGYQNKIRELIAKEEALGKRELAIKSQEETSKATAASIVEEASKKLEQADIAEKKYNDLSGQLTAKIELADAVLLEKSNHYETLGAKLLEERKTLADKLRDLEALQSENKEISLKLAAELKDLEGKRGFLKFYSGELDEKEATLKLKESQLSVDKLEIDNIKAAIIKQDKETQEILEQAKVLLESNQAKKVDLDIAKQLNVKEGASLASWRDELNEKEITLNEKERFLLLKVREIDGKIATLKKLREAA